MVFPEVSIVFQEVSMMFQEVSKKFQGSFKSRKFQGYFKIVLIVLKGRLKCISREISVGFKVI